MLSVRNNLRLSVFRFDGELSRTCSAEIPCSNSYDGNFKSDHVGQSTILLDSKDFLTLSERVVTKLGPRPR